MKNNDDKLYTIDEFTKEFAEKWEVKVKSQCKITVGKK